MNEALLPGGVVQALEQLIKRLDEHRDPGQAVAAGRCAGSTQGQERNRRRHRQLWHPRAAPQRAELL